MKEESKEDILKEVQEIDDIIIKLSNGEKAFCPKCGAELLGAKKAVVYCPNKDFEVHISIDMAP